MAKFKSSNKNTKGESTAGDPDVAAVIRLFEEVARSLGMQVGTRTGQSVSVTDAEGRHGRVDLNALYRFVADHDRPAWRERIMQYLRGAGPAADALVRQTITAGLEANAGRIIPCLKPPIKGHGPRLPWYQPLVEADETSRTMTRSLGLRSLAASFGVQENPDRGVCITLGIDLPDSIAYATSAMVEESGRPGSEWLARGLTNLQEMTPARWCRVNHEPSGARVSDLHDNYDASRALILDRLLPGSAERGWFVGIVNRDRVHFMPATEATTARYLVSFAEKVAKEYAETVAYTLSPEVYWVYQERWYRFPILKNEDAVSLVPPQEYCRAFGMLESTEEQE
jgi:hypothetical protein